jgi:23S rRNA (adenine2503-C2)-methyltransferase
MYQWLDLPSKVRWKLFRQFQSPAQLKADPNCQVVGFQPDDLQWNWHLVQISGDENAEKMLLRQLPVNDSRRVQSEVQCEVVTLMPPRRNGATKTPRATACISSQPGCGVGCPFCATGKLGYQGNLTASEIAEQVYWVGRQAALRGRQLRNVVYMGMGEPLHNFQQVLESLELLTHPKLFGLPQRCITVSTVGVPNAMLKLAQHFPNVKIALSLHSADPAQRRQLVPKAIADLEVLRETIRQLNQLQCDRVWLEVVMLGGVNDSQHHARQLISFCNGLRVEVNLIPYNPISKLQANSTEPISELPQFTSSTQADREAFAQALRSAGIRASIRTSFGSQSSAACGQLQASNSSTHIPF